MTDPSDAIKAMFDAQDYEEMHDYCQKLLAADPGDMLALQNISTALVCMGRHADAVPYCDRVLDKMPGDEYAFGNKLRALESLESNDDQIIGACDKMLHSSPANVMALTGAALALTRTGRHAESVSYYDRALSVLPDDATALLNKALSLTYLGEDGEALALYERAQRLVSGHDAKRVAAARSRIFSRMGMDDEAFLAAQGVPAGEEMQRIIRDARSNNCSAFHQFCDDEYSNILSAADAADAEDGNNDVGNNDVDNDNGRPHSDAR